MNVRHSITVSVVITALGQLGGAACGGKVGTTVAGGISADDGAAMDASASSTGGSGMGSGSSAGPSSSGGFGSSSGSSSSGSRSGAGSRSSSGGSAIDGSSGSSSGNGPESGGPDSGADTAAGDAFGGMDAAGDTGNAGGVTGHDGATGCGSAVSFSADVMPVFQRSCTLSSVCHGQMGNSAEENLYLGLNWGGGGAADSQAVYSGLVGVPSKEDPSMNLVTSGDLQNSFLWHKVNDDQTTLGTGTLATGCMNATTMCVDCTSTEPCGGTMPYLGEQLATSRPDDLCTLESWISQGALNN